MKEISKFIFQDYQDTSGCGREVHLINESKLKPRARKSIENLKQFSREQIFSEKPQKINFPDAFLLHLRQNMRKLTFSTPFWGGFVPRVTFFIH